MTEEVPTENKIVIRLLQPAMFSEVLRFASEALPATNYGPLGFNSVIARNTLRHTIRDQSMRAFIAFRGQRCVGLLIGTIAPMPWCGGLSATDLVFAAEQGGNLLLIKFVEWARGHRVVRIDMGVSDDGARPGYDKLFEREGFSRAGGLYFQQWPMSKGGA